MYGAAWVKFRRLLRTEAGEGVFINKDVVRNARRAWVGHYYNVYFPQGSLCFMSGSQQRF